MHHEAFDTRRDESPPTLSETAFRKLRKRWVQVALLLVGAALLMSVSALVLSPKRQPWAKDPKFLYCPKCDYESRYDQRLDGEPCTKCSQDPVGALVARETSIKEVGYKSPWKRVYIALSLEGIVAFGGLVYLLSRRPRSEGVTYFVFSCPHCNQRLRFRQISLGGLGLCSRCKRPVRFPEEDTAIREADRMREEQERLLAEEAAEEEEDE